MNSAEKQAVLHCLKSMIDEEVCEECPLYGTTGTDHCEEDCVRLAINALQQEPCEDVPDNNVGEMDCISRQAVLDCLTASGLKKFDFILDARDKIKNIPPVTPAEKVGKWIPVSEIEDIKSEINELSELDHAEPTYEDCKRDVLEIIEKYISGARMGDEKPHE